VQQVNVSDVKPAEIKYLYDIGGESIFAPGITEEEKERRRINDYIKQNFYEGGTIYDLLRILKG